MKTLTVAIVLLFSTVLCADEQRHITVTARSEVKVAPDEAILDLMVHTREKDLLPAKKANDKIASALVAIMPKHSIASSDVKVTDLDVSPDYGDYGHRQETPIAYDFTRSIEVRITDFKKTEPFLSDAFDAGLSHIGGLHFRVSNQRKHQFEARKLAVTYAREKAEHLTSLTGMQIGLPISIEEDVEHNWDAGGFGGAALGSAIPPAQLRPPPQLGPEFVFTAFQQAGPETNPVDINAPGQITITAEVTVKFEMTPTK